MTDRILSELVPVFGFCRYNSISDYLIECRAKSRLPENPETVIVCLFPYNLGDDKYEGSDISKYAVVPDYHKVISGILEKACSELKKAYPDEEFVCFTDNSPVPEVRAAVNAGLGVRGRNSLLINSEYGSWVFIGEIVTTKKYPYIEATEKECFNCGKCIESCPTHSVTEDGINILTCLSDITQRKGELNAEQEALIRKTGCIWGCDICQNTCPMNKKVKINPLPEFKTGARLRADAENLSDRAYAWRGKKTIERNIRILHKSKGEEK